jgi:hypothetical protein
MSMPKLLRKARRKIRRGMSADRELAAYHEAAHVLIAWVQGVRVDHVTLDPTGDVDAAVAKCHDFSALTSRACGTWIENARIAIAGRLADETAEKWGIEQVFAQKAEHNDERHFKLNLYHAAEKDRGRAADMIVQTVAEVQLNLDNRCRYWHALAEELSFRGVMEAADIERILGPLPEVDPVTIAKREATFSDIKAAQRP